MTLIRLARLASRPSWALAVVIDGKAEIRWGPMIVAKGIFYGEPVRFGWEVLGPYPASDLAVIFKRTAKVEDEILMLVNRYRTPTSEAT